MPLYSIIIPTYNSETTLAVCLNSIAQQSCTDFEILIMDGISQDRTLEIANDFKKILPGLIIISEKDNGIYDAMNNGLEKVSGEWILFLGSDDSLYDATVLQTVKKNIAITDAKVVYGNAKILGNTGWAKDGDIYDGEFSFTKLLKKNICHQAVFYNLRFLKDKVGYFNLSYKQCSDWDFNLRCWAKGKFNFINLIISNFSGGGASSNIVDTLFMNDYLQNVIKYFKLSPFDKNINHSNFIRYQEVIKLQKNKYPILFKLKQIKNVIKNRFSIK